MTERPPPMVPADVDLRDLDGFMLNVERLLASELWALSTGEEFKAAVGLWCRAWKQVPAGSLPDDDRVLAVFSGAGRKWGKVREMALRGFVKCSDGRLYHKVLCGDVRRAAEKKEEYEAGREADRERLQKWRESKRAKKELGNGDETPNETDMKRVSQAFRNGDETSSTGQGQGNKKEARASIPAAAAYSQSPAPPGHDASASDAANAGPSVDPRFRQVYAWIEANVGLSAFNGSRIHGWLKAGAEPERDILPTIAAITARQRAVQPGWMPRSLAYFDGAVGEAVKSATDPFYIPPMLKGDNSHDRPARSGFVRIAAELAAEDAARSGGAALAPTDDDHASAAGRGEGDDAPS